MKTERFTWILCLFFLCGVKGLFAQGTQRASDYMEAPATVKQYCDATFVLHHVPSGGDVDAITWSLPWDNIVGVANSSYNENGYWVESNTFVFTAPGTYRISAGGASKTIVVTSNPLTLSASSNICPRGTQLTFSEISSHLNRKFEFSGNQVSSMYVDDNGLLTYNDIYGGVCEISYSVKYGEKICGKLEKPLSINRKSHSISGTYCYTDGGYPVSPDYDLHGSSNFVPLGQEVTVDVDVSQARLLKFDLISNSNYSVDIREKNLYSGRIRFIITKGTNISFNYSLDYGCHVKTDRCDFTVRRMNTTYSVAAPAYSGIIRIEKENKDVVKSVPTTTPYNIVNALTGTVVLKGCLTQDINEVDASVLSNGIYVVQIYSGEEVQTHKISVRN